MGKQKKQGHGAPEHGKSRPHHHHHHHQQKPEAVADDGAYNPTVSWSSPARMANFVWSALQGPDGTYSSQQHQAQPIHPPGALCRQRMTNIPPLLKGVIRYRISGIDAAYPSPSAGSYPPSAAWPSGRQSAPAYGTYLAPQNVTTAAQQPGGGINAGASTSSSDRGGDCAHTNGDSDTSSGSDDSGSASHSEVRKKKGQVKSSSGHRHLHSSRHPTRHHSHRSRSAHRSRAHGHDRQAEKETQSQHKVHRWLGDDTVSDY